VGVMKDHLCIPVTPTGVINPASTRRWLAHR
jgi:hypothetical protein